MHAFHHFVVVGVGALSVGRTFFIDPVPFPSDMESRLNPNASVSATAEEDDLVKLKSGSFFEFIASCSLESLSIKSRLSFSGNLLHD